MKKKLQVTNYWKKVVHELRGNIVQYSGCRLKYDMKQNEIGDNIGMENFRAVMKAKTVTADFTLTVDVDAEPEEKRLDGLSVATFEGLAEGEDGITYAVFTNGRCLPMLKIETPLVEDSAERAARELSHARLAASKPTPPKKARKRGGVTQKEAADICGYSVSMIRAWDRGEHTPEGYPGRGDAVLLKAFAGRREQGKKMKAAVIGAIRPRNMDNVSHRVERGRRW